jgi:uncharacterized membrane protein YedE/YeeE
MTKMTPAQFIAVLLCGALFGFGLAWSTMIRPEVVLSFLRFQDWGLMLVMGGAIAVTLPAYQWGRRALGHRPLLGGEFEVRASRMDRDTLLGAALFGIGWGLGGFCPGPALTSAPSGLIDLTSVLVFIPTMLLGMIGFNKIDAALTASKS